MHVYTQRREFIKIVRYCEHEPNRESKAYNDSFTFVDLLSETRAQVLFDYPQLFVYGEGLYVHVSMVEYGEPWRLIQTPRLHTNRPVLYYINASNAMFASGTTQGYYETISPQLKMEKQVQTMNGIRYSTAVQFIDSFVVVHMKCYRGWV